MLRLDAIERIESRLFGAATALAQQWKEIDFFIFMMSWRGFVEVAPDRCRAALGFLVGADASDVSFRVG